MRDPLLTPVSVIPQKEFRSLGKGGSLMDTLALDAALERRWETPALFCTYFVESEQRTPRLRKADLRRVLKLGGHVSVSMLVFDYDRPKVDGKKDPWASQSQVDELLGRIIDLPDCPTAIYTTKHGARLIYVLTRAIEPHDAEQAYRAMQQRLRQGAIDSDDNTADWTRFFTLPFVTKEDDERLWENEFVFVETFGQRLDPAPLLREAKTFTPFVVEDDKPSPEQVERLLRVEAGNRMKMTPAMRRAKELLKNNVWAPYLFDDIPADFAVGERDTSVNRMAWSVIRGIWGKIEETGPEFAYALMRSAVAAIEPDEGHADWTDVLWEKVCRIWEEQHEEIELERLTFEAKAEKMLEGFRRQVFDSGANMKELMHAAGVDTEVDFMRLHLVVVAGKGTYHYMRPDGYYSERPTAAEGIQNAVRSLGLADVYGLDDTDGGIPLKLDKLLRLRGIAATDVEGKIGLRRAELRGFGSGELKLLAPAYFLRDIEPLYVPEVDAWLRALGGSSYDRLVDWIGHAQDIYRPICALSLVGPPGAGKTFLTELLGQRFGPGTKNSDKVFGAWSGNLAKNPVVHVEEGSTMFREGKAVDERFREFVSGGTLELSQKFQMDRGCEVYPRLVLTANDYESLRKTIASRDLDESSFEALARRIVHIDVPSTASDLLVRDETENWIGGDQLALRHFAWLHANRDRPSRWAGSGRFLVEGDSKSEVLEQARFSTPMMQAVMQTLVECVEAAGTRDVVAEPDGLLGYVGANASQIKRVMERKSFQHHKLQLDLKAIGRALRKLSVHLLKHPSRIWVIPAASLLRFAVEHGIPCKRLHDIYGRASKEAQLGEIEGSP